MHVGPFARQVAGEAADQSAEGLVSEPRRGHHQWRLRSHVPPKAAAAGFTSPTGVWLLARLPLPYIAARDAATSDRHRPIQVRRIQAERVDQGSTEPELLE